MSCHSPVLHIPIAGFWEGVSEEQTKTAERSDVAFCDLTPDITGRYSHYTVLVEAVAHQLRIKGR